MVMSAVRRFTVIMLVDRNPAIIFVMMMLIDADLRRAMRRAVNRPRRNRNAHAKRQPDKGKKAQERADGVVHSRISKRCRKIGQ
jgi:hypothetical protein